MSTIHTPQTTNHLSQPARQVSPTLAPPQHTERPALEGELILRRNGFDAVRDGRLVYRVDWSEVCNIAGWTGDNSFDCVEIGLRLRRSPGVLHVITDEQRGFHAVLTAIDLRFGRPVADQWHSVLARRLDDGPLPLWSDSPTAAALGELTLRCV